MNKITNEIKIGKYKFNFVNSIEIDSSWENLTDTCKIIIPKKISLNGTIYNGKDPLFKIGDAVEINLGYEHVNNKIFTGYVTFINPKLPMEIQCEDRMWIFKKVSIQPIAFKKISLSDLIDFLMSKVSTSKFYPAEGIEVDVNMKIDNLGKFRIASTSTPAQVLEHLRKEYGIQSFFRDGVLHVGLAYSPALKVEKTFQFQKNIISDDLIYKKADDYQVKVKAISIDANNKKKEIEVGDPEGEVRTLHYFDLSESALRKIAEEELLKLKWEGFQGSFETFGLPFVRHNDAAVLVDKKLPERNGTYLIKQVAYTFGMGGYRQNITIDRKIN